MNDLSQAVAALTAARRCNDVSRSRRSALAVVLTALAALATMALLLI
jgi:hypothetical protein